MMVKGDLRIIICDQCSHEFASRKPKGEAQCGFKGCGKKNQ